jgi:hypothetical protein
VLSSDGWSPARGYVLIPAKMRMAQDQRSRRVRSLLAAEVIMPEINEFAVAYEVRRLSPETRIILISNH